jgi:tetratricopeptide (TPR) repeat protein
VAGHSLQALLQRARRRHRDGDPAAALKDYRKVLARRPGVPEVLLLASTAALESGQLAEAEKLARQAVRARRDGPAQLMLGRALLAQDRPAAAREPLTAAGGDPRVGADAAFLLGECCGRLGDLPAAIEAYAGAVRTNPQHAAAWLALGRRLSAAGRHGQALEALATARALRPDDAGVAAACGMAALAAGRYDEARDAADRATAVEPRAPDVLRLRGRLEKAAGRLDAALSAWEELVALAPEDADAWGGVAEVRQALGRLDAAGEAWERALLLAPADPGLRAGRAEWLEWQGRYEEGLDTLADLTDDPAVTLTRARLLRRLGRAEEAYAALSALDLESLDATLRRSASFSLGDCADALGRYEAAFDHYRQGNALAAARWDEAAERQWQARLDALAAAAGAGGNGTGEQEIGKAGAGVLFVVGLPRSGTSLAEQILAAHPRVVAGGELPALGELAHTAAGGDPPDAAGLAELGRRYLAALPAVPGPVVVTDKMPLNFRYHALIDAALPGARVVHCRRDLRDVAVSCFATDFIDPALAFATRLDWLAAYIRFYEEIMAAWPARGRRIELDYAELVSRPEPAVRRLLEFAGLPWDDACLDFHRLDRVVATASHAQVREPFHTRSVGRWRHYRASLGELGALLERP